MSLLPQDVNELNLAIHRHTRKGFKLISNRLHEYTYLDRALRKDMVRVQDGGESYSFQLHAKTADYGGPVGINERRDINAADHVITGKYFWAGKRFSWLIDDVEQAINSGELKLFDVLESRETGAMIDFATKWEAEAWRVRAPGETNRLLGIPNFVVPSATDTTAATGPTGQHPNGWDNVGNISSTTYDMWRNGSQRFITISHDDFVMAFVQQCRLAQYRPPINLQQFRSAMGMRYAGYTTGEVVDNLGRLARQQNDNLGNDLAEYDGQVTIKKIPIKWVPQIDQTQAAVGATVATLNTPPANACYVLDHADLHYRVLKGNNMRRIGPMVVSGEMPTSLAFHLIHWSMNVCESRRNQFILYQVASL